MQTGFDTHPNTCPEGTGDPIREYSRWDMELNYYYIVCVCGGGGYTSTPPYMFMVWYLVKNQYSFPSSFFCPIGMK
jgi:hypothetical protein